MPNSVHLQLADAVVVELNDPARAWAGQFTAIRSWYPLFTGIELESLRVAVIADRIDSKRLGRPGMKNEHRFTIQIDMQKSLSITSATFQADADVLDKLAQ